MTAPPKMLALEAALAALPENVVGEIIFGELVTQPRPRVRHARVPWKLSTLLDPPFEEGQDGPGGWLFLIEPEIAFGPHVLVPDIAGWRRETLPELPDVARLDVPPDFVCEILSPGTEPRDRTDKLVIYGASDVRWSWLVDVPRGVVEVRRSERGHWTELGAFAGEGARVPPFDAAPLALDKLFTR